MAQVVVPAGAAAQLHAGVAHQTLVAQRLRAERERQAGRLVADTEALLLWAQQRWTRPVQRLVLLAAAEAFTAIRLGRQGRARQSLGGLVGDLRDNLMQLRRVLGEWRDREASKTPWEAEHG
jgi:hypothetical protein